MAAATTTTTEGRLLGNDGTLGEGKLIGREVLDSMSKMLSFEHGQTYKLFQSYSSERETFLSCRINSGSLYSIGTLLIPVVDMARNNLARQLQFQTKKQTRMQLQAIKV